MPAAEPVLVRLWRRVDTSRDCWVWTGCQVSGGHGVIWTRSNGTRRHDLVHRLAWEQAHGPVPDGFHVLHRCDNPPCVRVDHLFLGTNADNVADRVSKRRSAGAPGETNGHAKLSAEDVAEIRRLYRPGQPGRPRKDAGRLTSGQLAARFGVNRSTIYHIARGWTWG